MTVILIIIVGLCIGSITTIFVLETIYSKQTHEYLLHQHWEFPHTRQDIMTYIKELTLKIFATMTGNGSATELLSNAMASVVVWPTKQVVVVTRSSYQAEALRSRCENVFGSITDQIIFSNVDEVFGKDEIPESLRKPYIMFVDDSVHCKGEIGFKWAGQG